MLRLYVHCVYCIHILNIYSDDGPHTQSLLKCTLPYSWKLHEFKQALYCHCFPPTALYTNLKTFRPIMSVLRVIVLLAAPNVLLFLNVTTDQPFSAGPITPLNEHVTVPVDCAGIMVNVIPGTKAFFCFLNGKSQEKTYKIYLCEEDEELLRNHNSCKRMLNLCKPELLYHTSVNF